MAAWYIYPGVYHSQDDTCMGVPTYRAQSIVLSVFQGLGKTPSRGPRASNHADMSLEYGRQWPSGAARMHTAAPRQQSMLVTCISALNSVPNPGLDAPPRSPGAPPHTLTPSSSIRWVLRRLQMWDAVGPHIRRLALSHWEVSPWSIPAISVAPRRGCLSRPTWGKYWIGQQATDTHRRLLPLMGRQARVRKESLDRIP